MRDQEHQFRDFVEKAVRPHMHNFSKLRSGAVVSTTEEDTRLSFDMRVGLWVPVSVRLRSNYYLKYRDFSIRSKTRYSGKVINGELVKCELDKLKEGYGNCYFYGWLTEDGQSIEQYILVDMNRFRHRLNYGKDRPNPDGFTWGRYYDLDSVRTAGALVFQSWMEAAA